MNKDMLKEITAICAKYPVSSDTTLFLMQYEGETDMFTGTAVYGALMKEGYDIREGM